MDTTRYQIINEIISIISNETGVSIEDIKSRSRLTEKCDARQMFLAYMGSQSDVYYTLAEIAAAVNRSHCIVGFSKKQVQDKRDTEPEFDIMYSKIEAKIKESKVLSELIIRYKKYTGREMNADEINATIVLIKKQLQNLEHWLSEHIDNPIRPTIARDKRDLEDRLESLELQLMKLAS